MKRALTGNICAFIALLLIIERLNGISAMITYLQAKKKRQSNFIFIGRQIKSVPFIIQLNIDLGGYFLSY